VPLYGPACGCVSRDLKSILVSINDIDWLVGWLIESGSGALALVRSVPFIHWCVLSFISSTSSLFHSVTGHSFFLLGKRLQIEFDFEWVIGLLAAQIGRRLYVWREVLNRPRTRLVHVITELDPLSFQLQRHRPRVVRPRTKTRNEILTEILILISLKSK